MKLNQSELSKWMMLLLHIICFFILILPGIMSLNNIVILLIFLVLEACTVSLFVYRKEKKYFYVLWQFQFFFLMLVLIILAPQQTFQIAKISIRTIATLVGLLIGVETLVVLYLVFQERAVKKILFILSLSTTIAVFLIVLFVMNEGLPAFQETSPADFITGTTWHPYYQLGTNDTITLTTTVQPYDFTITAADDYIYLKPGTWNNLTITLTNTGGNNDTIKLFTTSELQGMVQPQQLSLQRQESQYITYSVYIPQEQQYTTTITAVSENSQRQKTITLSLIGSLWGIDITPDFFYIQSSMDALGSKKMIINVTNTGTVADDFLLSIEAPDQFRPSIDELAETWNYTTSTDELTLNANETITLTINPRITSLVPGEYNITIKATAKTNPEITDETHLHFSFKTDRFIDTDTTNQVVPLNGTAIYTLNVTNGEKFTISINHSVSVWKSNLIFSNETILENEGSASINRTGNSQNLYLQVIGPATNSTNMVTLTISYEGAQPTFGILPFIIGTFLTTGIAILIAAPLGIGCAIFLAEYSPKKLRTLLKPLYELLAGIPSVIYGLWGFLTLGPFLKNTLYPPIANTLGRYIWFLSPTSRMGADVLTASFVLSIMILPIIITLSEDAIQVVRKELKEGSLAVGATRWQTIRHILLPEAKSGIVTSIILGTGRAIGETMAVLMIIGAFSQIPASLFDSTGTMTSVIAGTLGWSFTYDLTRHALFAVGIILFFMIFLLNIIIFIIQKKTEQSLLKKHRNNSKFMKLKKPLQKTSTLLKKKLMRNIRHKKFTIVEYMNKRQETKKSISLHVQNQIQGFTRKTKRKEQSIQIMLFIGAIIATSFLFFIIGDIIVRGGLVLKPEYLFERELGGGLEGGFANAIVGSLQMIGIAIAVAAPLSIGSAIYVQEYAKKNNILTRIILFASDTLASTPSIVFGAFGFMFFVIFLEFRFSMLAGGFTLAIMIIPLLLRSSIEAIKAIPREFEEGALALGVTKWQTIRTVILPPASPGISSGIIISIGRAIGETAAVMFTAGYAASIASSLLEPTASMPNMIFLYYSVGAQWPSVAEKVYSAAFVLIIMVLILNAVARFVSYRASKMMRP